MILTKSLNTGKIVHFSITTHRNSSIQGRAFAKPQDRKRLEIEFWKNWDAKP